MRTGYLLLLLLLLLNINLLSQTVSEEVKFDNISDQSNYFNGMQSLVQIPTNGITGGCLQSPDSNNWGNDNSLYCSKYKGINNETYKTSICFLYDSVNTSGYDRAASIWLYPHTDFNHYIISSVSHQRKIEISTYGSFNASFIPMPLMIGHWYMLEQVFNISSVPVNNTTNFSAKVLDLGAIPGSTQPVLIDSIGNFMIDSIFSLDDAISVSITGASYGGGKLLDDFHFEGVKSADSCLTSSINQLEDKLTIKIHLDNNLLIAAGEELENSSYFIP